MNIFLTGSTGFIGSYFLKYALSIGNKVISIIRKEILKLNKRHINLKKNLLEVNHEDLKDIDTVVHLACAGVSPKKVNFSELYEINVLASVHLMQEAIKAGEELTLKYKLYDPVEIIDEYKGNPNWAGDD